MKINVFSGLLLVVISVNVAASAQDNNSSNGGSISTTESTTVSPTTNNAASTKTTFKLSAQKVELSLEKLNDIAADLKNILSVSRHLYDEVMVQPVTVITEPEIINSTVISIPVGTQPTGPPRPARKERVDALMAQMRPMVDLLKTNADDFMSDSEVTEYPPDMEEKVDPLFKKWLAYMDDVYARLLTLEKLTVGPTYDNYAIAGTCQLIERDVKKVDEVRHPIYKLIQEEGKKLMSST